MRTSTLIEVGGNCARFSETPRFHIALHAVVIVVIMAELGDANAKSRLAVLEAQVRERRARDAADGAGASAGAGAAPSGSAGASGGAVTAAPPSSLAGSSSCAWTPQRGPPPPAELGYNPEQVKAYFSSATEKQLS